MSMIQYSEYIDNFIEKTYGSGSANFCWAGLFTSTEATADGSEKARAVFQTFKNSITGMKVQLYQKGFRGQLVFGLKHDGDEENLIDQIILDLNATGYAVGETLTETLNGYNLTYKVTNKDEEAELYNVPQDFTGTLNIPARICDGILKVTSIGQDALRGCYQISSVIIPEGVTVATYFAMSCTDLYLPSTLKKCGLYAFAFNSKLRNVHIKATTPPTISFGVFSFCGEDITLYVPKGCKKAYANANGWKNFKNIVEE